MNDANKRTLLDWFKELKINKLLNVNIGGMTSGVGLATESTLNDVKTSIQILDNIVSGNEAQVDIVASLPIGSNVIGKVSIDQTTPGTTNLVQNKQMPDATATFSTDSVTSSALEASGVIKASAGTLYGFSGYSSLAAGQFILLFNSPTVPVDTTVPNFTPIAVNANGNFSVDFGTYGKHFSAGISWSNSSTAATKTIGAADCFISAEIK